MYGFDEGGALIGGYTAIAIAERHMVATIDQVRAQNRQLRNQDLLAAVMKLGEIYRPAYIGEVGARVRLAAGTQRPFLERITQFWSNHFAVSVDKAIILGVAGSYEREAIRPNVLGRFQDLLLAVEGHPAMLLYLDNYRSVGPDSPLAVRAQQRAGKALGINENLAREIMELHTLGVDGGYTQVDVTAFAKVITGWSIGAAGQGIRAGGVPGDFYFRGNIHEPGSQSVLGRRYDKALRPLGLSNGQFSLLMALNRPGQASVSDLAAVLGMDRTTVTAMLKPLERRGLVASAADGRDRRQRGLTLSDAGRELLTAALPVWKAMQAEIEASLAEPERMLAELRALG